MSEEGDFPARASSGTQEGVRSMLPSISPLITNADNQADNTVACSAEDLSSAVPSRTLTDTLKQISHKLEEEQQPVRGYESDVILQGLSSNSKKDVLYAIFAIIFACSSCCRINQDMFATLPETMRKLVALLGHKHSQVAKKAAEAIAALCAGVHRGNQDILATTRNAVPLLGALLLQENTALSAAYALGRACEGAHNHNQNLIANAPQVVASLCALAQHRDPEISCAAAFASQRARPGLDSVGTAAWEQAGGSLRRSSSAPRASLAALTDVASPAYSGAQEPDSPLSPVSPMRGQQANDLRRRRTLALLDTHSPSSLPAPEAQKRGSMVAMNDPVLQGSTVASVRRSTAIAIGGSMIECNPVVGSQRRSVLKLDQVAHPVGPRGILQRRLASTNTGLKRSATTTALPSTFSTIAE